MASPNEEESRDEFGSRRAPAALEEGTAEDNEQAVAVFSSTREESTKELKRTETTSSLRFKETEELDEIIVGLAATTHPDRVGDILSVRALTEIADAINNTKKVTPGNEGGIRLVSLFHDWIRNNDPDLDAAASLRPTARVVDLGDGHKGVEVEAKLNRDYVGPMSYDEIKRRIEDGYISGLSIEYRPDESRTRKVKHDGVEYRFIDGFSEIAGVGFARPRNIANPYAVIYKEIEQKAQEVSEMDNETKSAAAEGTGKEDPLAAKEAETSPNEETVEGSNERPQFKEAEPEPTPEEKPQVKEADDSDKIKEVLESKEFKDAVDRHIEVKSKVHKETQGENMSLELKEMNKMLESKEFDAGIWKNMASRYIATKEYTQMFREGGIPLRHNLDVKADGSSKLRIYGNLEAKDILDTTTNPGAYTESPVEFADLFVPGIVDTFNNQTNLFGAIPKRNNLEGGITYGWTIFTDQNTGYATDPDSTAVNKEAAGKLKLRTPIKVYRGGVSVTDFTLHHSRASLGDLFQVEVDKVLRNVLRDLNGDMFKKTADGDGNAVLGLGAVADSAGSTTLYGKTRSAANRLAPNSASDTYKAVGGAVTTALIRGAATKLEEEGAMRENLRFIMSPARRDKVFGLNDSNQRFTTVDPNFGFSGQLRVDGIPAIVDSQCPDNAIFCVDFESYYAVISKAPSLTGLAKVGAAEEAYLELYLAIVYEQPRRIHMLDTLI